MKSKNVYDPIGTFTLKDKKIKWDVVVLLPLESEEKETGKKIKLCLVKHIIKSNVYLVIVKEKSKKDEENRNLRALVGGVQDFFHLKELEEDPSKFPKDMDSVNMIIFHSTNPHPKIDECLRNYVEEDKNETFENFYKKWRESNSLASENKYMQPETSGGGILVGV